MGAILRDLVRGVTLPMGFARKGTFAAPLVVLTLIATKLVIVLFAQPVTANLVAFATNTVSPSQIVLELAACAWRISARPGAWPRALLIWTASLGAAHARSASMKSARREVATPFAQLMLTAHARPHALHALMESARQHAVASARMTLSARARSQGAGIAT